MCISSRSSFSKWTRLYQLLVYCVWLIVAINQVIGIRLVRSVPVSYTHLDVYKRQPICHAVKKCTNCERLYYLVSSKICNVFMRLGKKVYFLVYRVKKTIFMLWKKHLITKCNESNIWKQERKEFNKLTKEYNNGKM